MLAGGASGAISCITIPGVRSLVNAVIFGAAGDFVGSVILGEIKSINDLCHALGEGAFAGFLGYGASKVLVKGVTTYFKGLSKMAQRSFLRKIGKITGSEFRAIRREVANGLTPSILKKLVAKYGYDTIVSAFVSSTTTSIR